MSAIPCKVFSEHQWAFYYWLTSGLKDATLIHCDTHADLNGLYGEVPSELLGENPELVRQFTEKSLAITNFIAPAVWLGIVKEIYWVLPEWAARGSKYEKYYWGFSAAEKVPQSYGESLNLEAIKENEERITAFREFEKQAQLVLARESADFKYFAAQLEGYLHFMPFGVANSPPFRGEMSRSDRGGPNCGESAPKEILVHKVYLGELPPNLTNTILDIDLDYFSCTGFDTFSVGLPQFTVPELASSVHNFARQLKGDSSFVPKLITIATSPNYTPLEHLQILPKLLEKEFGLQGLVLEVEEAHITYNLEVQVLVKNLRLKVEHLLKGDPRRGNESDAESRSIGPSTPLRDRGSDYFEDLMAFWGQFDALDQYFIPPECFKQDDFKLFLEKPIRSVSLQNRDFSQFLELLGKYGLLEVKQMLDGFVGLYLTPSASWSDLQIVADGLLSAISNIEAKVAKFDQRIIEMIGVFKVKKEVDRKNRDGYESLMGMMDGFKV